MTSDADECCIRAEEHKPSSLDGFWETLTPEQIRGIEAIAIDMWDPYIASLREHVPEADGKIVFDKFHVAQHFGGCRRQGTGEGKTLKACGNDRLTGARYDWLKNPTSMEPKDRKEFARWWHGSWESVATDDRGGADAQTAIREYHHVLAASDRLLTA